MPCISRSIHGIEALARLGKGLNVRLHVFLYVRLNVFYNVFASLTLFTSICKSKVVAFANDRAASMPPASKGKERQRINLPF